MSRKRGLTEGGGKVQIRSHEESDPNGTSTDVRLRDGRVLITGVNGFIAGHLAERLLRLGVPVRGTARHEERAAWLAKQGADVVPVDLSDQRGLTAAAEDCTALVHAAAWTGGGGSEARHGWTVNVEGTRRALSAAVAGGVQRFVYLSSVAVYGLNRAPLVDEGMPTPLVSEAYPDSKIAAEQLVQESGLPSVIVRPASTYGPRGGAWTVAPIQRIRAGQLVLFGKDDGLITPGYIDNVVDGLVLALVSPAAIGEIFNLCDDRAVTYRQYYMAYARMLGLDRLPTLPAVVGRLARSTPAGLVRRLIGRRPVGPWSVHFRFNPSQFSVEKAQRTLGYRTGVDFAEGMRRTEAWLRAQGYV